MGAEIPGRGTHADRADAGDVGEHIGGAHHQVALVLRRQLAVKFVDPAVNADLVAGGGHGPLFVRVDLGDHGGDEEARRDIVFGEQAEDAGDRHPAAVLPLGQFPRRAFAVAQGARFMIGIERQGDRHPGAALPLPGL